MKNWPWYGYLILALIIFGLVFVFYFKPNDTAYKGVKAEREKLELEVRGLRAKKQQLDKIEADLVSMNKTLKELETIIPQKREISEILRRIQQLVNDAGLEIIKFAPRGEIRKGFYAEWPIPIEITGNYHNLAIFFDRLCHSSRIFNIENFAIRSAKSQTTATTISANFTAKTYYFLEEKAAPAESAAKPRKKP